MDKTETKQAWEYDGTPRVLTWQNRSPISGKWQIPYGVTLVEPPKEKEGYTRKFDGTEWEYVEIPKEPEPEPEPETKEEKLAELDAQYESDKKQIYDYYVDAILHNDTELIEELKAEMQELDEQYKADRAEIEGSEEQ